MFFFPEQEHVLLPSDLGLNYEDVYFESGDGVRIHGWLLPAKGESKGVILHAHGNAENISTHISSVYWLPSRGFDVLTIDYRGYGLSQGSPSVAGAIEDIKAAIELLVSRFDRDVYIFGQSLGGALSVCAVGSSRYRERIKGVILESAFSSYSQVFREKLSQFWLTWPLQWVLSPMVSDRWSPIRCVRGLDGISLLIIHGVLDKVVSISHAEKLYKIAGGPKEMWILPDTSHINAFQKEQYRERLLRYLGAEELIK